MRKPKLEYYWSPVYARREGAPPIGESRGLIGHEVRWRVVGANGEIVLPGEGHADRGSAEAAILRGIELLLGVRDGSTREVGPGRKPELFSEAP